MRNSRPFSKLYLSILIFGDLLAMRVNAQQLYWIESRSSGQSRLGKVNLDGTGSTTLSLALGSGFASVGVDTSSALGKVYFYDGGQNAIRSTDLNFNGAATVISNVLNAQGEGVVTNVAVDASAHKLFYITGEIGFTTALAFDLNTNGIKAADLQQSGLVGDFSADLAADPISQVVYCTRNTGDVIPVAYSDFAVPGNQFQPHSILNAASPITGIDLDLPAGKMYLALSALHEIVRANLDGSGLETVLTLGSTDTPTSMSLFGGRMYWADGADGRIESANINGTDLQTLISGLHNPTAVSIVPEPSTIWLACAIALFVQCRKCRCPVKTIVAPA